MLSKEPIAKNGVSKRPETFMGQAVSPYESEKFFKSFKNLIKFVGWHCSAASLRDAIIEGYASPSAMEVFQNYYNSSMAKLYSKIEDYEGRIEQYFNAVNKIYKKYGMETTVDLDDYTRFLHNRNRRNYYMKTMERFIKVNKIISLDGLEALYRNRPTRNTSKR